MLGIAFYLWNALPPETCPPNWRAFFPNQATPQMQRASAMPGFMNSVRASPMVEKRIDRSRRNVIHAVVKGVLAGLLLRTSRTEASEKMTRQQAEYQDTPKGIY